MALSLVRLHLKTKKKPSKINTNTTEDNDFPIFKTVFNYHIIGLSNEANNFFLAQLTQKFEVSKKSVVYTKLHFFDTLKFDDYQLLSKLIWKKLLFNMSSLFKGEMAQRMPME